MGDFSIAYYKGQYEKLLNHNQELEAQVGSLEKRIGGRKPADKLKYLGMRRLTIKKAIRLFGNFGVCWFHCSKSTDKRISRELSVLFNK